MKHLLLTTIAAVVLVGCSESGELNQLAEEVKTASNKKHESVHESVIKGDIQAINKFLDNGGDIHLPNHKGYTMLHEAAFEGKVEIGKLLISRGADVDSSDGIGFTVLHAAAAFGHEVFVKLLLDNDVDTNVEIEAGPLEGKTPYDAAISGANGQRNEQIADLISKHGGKTAKELKGGEPVVKVAQPEPPTAKAPDFSIHDAAKGGNIEVVKQHLAAGTDVNAESRDKYRRTLLHFAALGGHKELIELLITKGADVNANSNYGTPLHIAAGSGHKEAVELLIAKGAGVNAKEGFTGSTPLNEATGQGHNQVIELLIAKGADVNAKNGLGFTPLDIATIPDTRFDTTETADLLRKHGGKHSSIHEAAAGGDAKGVLGCWHGC